MVPCYRDELSVILGLPRAGRAGKGPRPAQLISHGEPHMDRWMDANPDRTTKERLVLLYAWNENGEVGYLTPTKSEGDAYLKAIHAVLKCK